MRTVFYLLVFSFFFTFSAFSQKKTKENKVQSSKEMQAHPVLPVQPVSTETLAIPPHFFVMASPEDEDVYKFLLTFQESKSFRIVPVKSRASVFMVVAENEVLLSVLRKGFSNLVTFDSKQAKSLGVLFQSPEVLEGEYLQKYLKSF